MPRIGRFRRRLWLVALAFCATAAKAEIVNVPAAPLFAEMPFPRQGEFLRNSSGEVSWLGGANVYCRADKTLPCDDWGLVQYHWSPASGVHSFEKLGLPGSYFPQVVAGRNLWAYTVTRSSDLRPGQVVLKTPDGLIAQEFSPPLTTQIDRLVALGEDRILAIKRDKPDLFPSGLLLQRVGQNIVQQTMPELPVAHRQDYAVVALDDRRIMLIGGGSGLYRGCMFGCSAETHILDIQERRWTPGPTMLEGRAEAVAARLPDGSVLVAGGFTKDADWGPGPSRTAEIWHPGSGQFEQLPPMPVATALAHARWAPGQEGHTLLMVEGMSAGISAFDVQRQAWYFAGAWQAGREEGRCASVPFTRNGQTWVWQDSCSPDLIRLARLMEPREPGAQAKGPALTEVVVGEWGSSLLPLKGDRPAVLVGGTMNVGSQYPDTGVVMGVDAAGRAFALPTLNHARRNANVVRVGDGVLVAGGTNKTAYRPNQTPPPVEWLSSIERGLDARWTVLANTGFDASSVVTSRRTSDGLLELARTTDVMRVRVKPGSQNDAPEFERELWTSMLRARRSTDDSPVQMRELSDGRVIVAGGEIQSESIALWSDEVEHSNTAPDSYVPTGYWGPELQHAIIAPDDKVTMSAPSKLPGGAVAVLDDGRVVKAHKASEGSRLSFEIHSPETMVWSDLSAPPEEMKVHEWRILAQGNELLLAGQKQLGDPYQPPRAVWRMNFAANVWEKVWEDSVVKPEKGESLIPPTRAYNGLVIVVLPDGKRAVIP